LGDRQSSHPVKTLLQYYGNSLEALPGVAYPGFRDNCSTLNTKTGFKKKNVTSGRVVYYYNQYTNAFYNKADITETRQMDQYLPHGIDATLLTSS